MRTVVVGDIHGCYVELKDLISSLEENGKYNKDTDKLIFLGDYVDRGEDSRSVIKFIRDMQKNNSNVIALMGNHEDMLLHYINGVDDYWTFNGCEATIKSYSGFADQLTDDIAWMRTLPLYHEDEHFIYVHAGVDVNKPIDQQDKETLLWIRDSFVFNRKEYYKQVVFGHTPTMNLNGINKPIYTYANNIAMDTGCVYGGALSALIIEDGDVMEFYQVESYNEDEENDNEYMSV